MTPYTNPHSSQTPRYGSNTPSPGSSTSHLTYGNQSHNDRNSKGARYGNLQRFDNKNHRTQRTNESLEWQIASDSWARRKRVNPVIPQSRAESI